MKDIKESIHDYAAEFRMKNRSEKIKAIKKHIIQSIIVVLLICSPVFLSKISRRLQLTMHMQEIELLPLSEKWKLIADRYAHFECEYEADESIRDAGYDPKTQAGMSYAIERKICNVVPNDDAEFTIIWHGTKPDANYY